MKNKRVIITGGTEGLGRACVDLFVAAGARVATCARSEKNLAQLKVKHGDNIVAKSVDLTDIAATQDFVGMVAKQWKGVDALVFNPPHSVKVPISQMSLADWQKSFEALYAGMIAAIERVLPYMIDAKKGSVVVISSLAAIEPIDVMPASSVLRGGIAAWVKLMTRQYGPKGVRFNAVMPGYMDTPAVRKGFQSKAKDMGKTPDQLVHDFCQTVPLKRLGRPEEVANAVAFLASDAASFITGTTLLVDGGLVKGV